MKKQGLKFEAYTDGSCDNLSPYKEGGSAYVVLQDGIIIKERKKGFVCTTNNRMEMLAIISAVNSVPPGSTITVHTDSQYCIKAFTACKNPKKNKELICLYNHVAEGKKVVFSWVKGHAGDEMNEHVDALAYEAYQEMITKYDLPRNRIKR